MSRRNGQATRERILRAALTEFTRRGFAGTRVDGIASRAKVNKALLYQYYGDKERLFQQVLESKMEELGRLRADPERFVETAGDVFDLYAANPWLVRLMLWEALDFGTKPVPNEEARARRLAEHVASLEDAQRAGAVDASLDPRHTLVTMMGLISFSFAVPQAARMILGRDPYSPEALAERRAHVLDVARRILETR